MRKSVFILSALFVAVSLFGANLPAEKTTVKPINLDEKSFKEKVHNYASNSNEWKYNGDKPAIVDFWAPWCGPCRKIAPVLEELAAEYGDKIYIYKVNVDEAKDLAAAFGIRSIPSLLFIPMDGEPQMAKGAIPKAQLKNAIDTFLLAE